MKYLGIILFAVGIALVGLSFYTMHRINETTGAIYEATDNVTDNPLLGLGGKPAKNAGNEVGSTLDSEVAGQVGPYAKFATIEKFLGIILIVAGASISLTQIMQKKKH